MCACETQIANDHYHRVSIMDVAILSGVPKDIESYGLILNETATELDETT